MLISKLPRARGNSILTAMDNNLEKNESRGESLIRFVSSKKVINLKSLLVLAIVVLAVLGYKYRGLFIAASVNGSPISRFSIIRMLEKQSGKVVLDNLITEKLIEGEARKMGVSIPKEEIEAVLKNIEEQVKAQGQTLDQALAMRNMSKEDLIAQITIEKKLQKLLSDKIQISDADIDTYIKDNKITPPNGQELDFRKNIQDQLQQQKLSSEADIFIAGLKDKASIGRFAGY